MNERNTIQKEFIRNYMKMSHSHPTAQEIFDDAKKNNQKIALTSIYRILNELVEKKELIAITTSDNVVHYDFFEIVHSHFICEKCHRIIDIPDDSSLWHSFLRNHSKECAKIKHIEIIGACTDCLLSKK
jgi:Fur family peroxide stress response transcriptional regulator